MADGVATLPRGLPELTLGWGIIKHATEWLIQPNGPLAGKPWTPIDSQARFMLWWYAFEVDAHGQFDHWLYHHGVRRLAKGSGKSPFAAVMSIEELVGPVRFDYLDPDQPGGCVGKPVDMPLVQIAATAESQTANTMRMVRAMAAKKSRVVEHYKIDTGKTIFYTPNGGQLEIITSSASAAEGAEVTFAIEDETEHWRPATGGPDLAGTLDRNLAKSSSRAIETANAWQPGAGSVAEDTYKAWQAGEEGKVAGGILYDARIAPADVDLHDKKSLLAALKFVYGDCFWVDLRTIMGRIHDLRTGEDVSRRFYLNQPTATEDAWTTPMDWAALEAPKHEDEETGLVAHDREVKDGEEIVMFFDGSKSKDATGLVGCCMSDGHVFAIGSWEPNPNDPADVVPAAAVDACVERAFDRWEIIAFFADVKEWEGFTKATWPDRYGDDLLVHSVPGGKDPQSIAWDMRSHAYDFTLACEFTADEILERSFTHDGDPVMARHVINARRKDGRYGISIWKESKDSPLKIDLAVCMIGARMVRRLVLAHSDWQKRSTQSTGPQMAVFYK